MAFRMFQFFLRELSNSLRRNTLMMIASVATMAVLILLLGLSLIFYNNVKKLRGAIASQMEIHAYLKENLPDSKILSLRGEVFSLPSVESVIYVSKNNALEKLRKEMQDPINLSGIVANPLPAYLAIRVSDPKQIEPAAQAVQRMEGIATVNYLQKAAKNFVFLSRLFEQGLFLFVAFLLFSSLLIIFHTIHLGVSSRKKEIEIMELVGASAGIIRWPFILEGTFYGLLGAILAIALLEPGYALFLNKVQDFFFSSDLMGGKEVWSLLLQLTVAGAAVGALGSYLSVNRYLKC